MCPIANSNRAFAVVDSTPTDARRQIGRKGNVDKRFRTATRRVPEVQVARAPTRYAWQKQASPPPPSAHPSADDGEAAARAVLAPPVFSRGQPPMCSCLLAYNRKPKVRRFFLSAAARLLSRLHPTDPTTDQTVNIRQTDQEMMHFELHRGSAVDDQGEAAEQPAVLLLPEEYYCPAAKGSRQALDFVTMVNKRIKPYWGYNARGTGLMARDQDRYQSGSVKDCHAIHIKLTASALARWNVSGAVPWLNLGWILKRQPLEMFCAERRALNITPGCTVPSVSTLRQPLLVTDTRNTSQERLITELPADLQQRFDKCAAGKRRFCWNTCKVNGLSPVRNRETFLSPIR
jgi:hypothetical protein